MGASDFSKLPHIGESVRRKEDYRFLTGAGQYTDDIDLANMTHCVFVRSPHAHATIKSINKKAALAAPGACHRPEMAQAMMSKSMVTVTILFSLIGLMKNMFPG